MGAPTCRTSLADLRPGTKESKGFTIVELLAVIAIDGILMGNTCKGLTRIEYSGIAIANIR